MGLCAHVDSVRVSEDAVRAVPAPEFTKSWHPFAHGKVIDAVTEAAQNIGHSVERMEFSLTLEGKNMFSVMHLKSKPEMLTVPGLISDDMLGQSGWCVGIRNSISKRFALGLCAGTSVFVCDNLMLSGEFVEFRKHTGGLDWEALITIAKRAVYRVVRKIQMVQAWQESLRALPLEPMSLPFKAMTFDLVNQEIMPVTFMPKFLGAFDTECREGAAPGTMYAFHGAITRMLRESNLFGVSKTTSRVQPYMDKAINLYLDTEFGGFAAVKEKFPKDVSVDETDKFLSRNGNGGKPAAEEPALPPLETVPVDSQEEPRRGGIFQKVIGRWRN